MNIDFDYLHRIYLGKEMDPAVIFQEEIGIVTNGPAVTLSKVNASKDEINGAINTCRAAYQVLYYILEHGDYLDYAAPLRALSVLIGLEEKKGDKRGAARDWDEYERLYAKFVEFTKNTGRNPPDVLYSAKITRHNIEKSIDNDAVKNNEIDGYVSRLEDLRRASAPGSIDEVKIINDEIALLVRKNTRNPEDNFNRVLRLIDDGSTKLSRIRRIDSDYRNLLNAQFSLWKGEALFATARDRNTQQAAEACFKTASDIASRTRVFFLIPEIYAQWGVCLFSLGDNARAIELCTKALTSLNKLKDQRLTRLNSVSNRDFEDAMKSIFDIIYTISGVRGTLTDLYKATGDYADALTTANARITELVSPDIAGHQNAVAGHQREFDYQVELNKAYVERGKVRLELKDYINAEKDLTTAETNFAGNAENHYRGLYIIKSDEYNVAFEAAKHIPGGQIDSQVAREFDDVRLNYAKALKAKGNYLAQTNNIEDAAKYYSAAMSVISGLDNAETRLLTSEICLDMSYAQLALGNYDDVLTSVQTGIAALPQNDLPYTKQLEFKLRETRIFAYLNKGDLNDRNNALSERAQLIHDIKDEMALVSNRASVRAPAAERGRSRNRVPADKPVPMDDFGLFLNIMLTNNCQGYGDQLAEAGQIEGSSQAYQGATDAYKSVLSIFAKANADQKKSNMSAVLEAQVNAMTAHLRIGDQLKIGNKPEGAMAEYAAAIDLAKDKDIPVPENAQQKIAVARVYRIRAEAKARLPEARLNDFAGVKDDIDKAAELCDGVIEQGSNDIFNRITAADVHIFCAEILSNMKGKAGSVEWHLMKEAQAEAQKAINCLTKKEFYEKNANNLQVKMKLAQANETKGYALLNCVAALKETKEEAKKCFETAEALYKGGSILGMARMRKGIGDVNMSLGQCADAKKDYEGALKYLEGAPVSKEERWLQADICFGLGIVFNSLLQGEEISDDGDSPQRLIDDCPKAFEQYIKALELLGVSSDDLKGVYSKKEILAVSSKDIPEISLKDAFRKILKDLKELPEEKRLFGYNILLKIEMGNTISNERQEDLYKAALSNLGNPSIKESIKGTLSAEVAQFSPYFLDAKAVSMLAREIDLNIGRLRLWNKDFIEARKIFASVLQDKNGKSLYDILKANQNADVTEEVAAIIRTLPDDINLAAVIHLGESWKWSDDDKDDDQAGLLLDLPVSEKERSSEGLPIKSYCPNYLNDEAERVSSGSSSRANISAGVSANGKITDYHVAAQSKPIAFLGGITANIGGGAGLVQYKVREPFIDQYNNVTHKLGDKKDVYAHFDLGVSKYWNDKDYAGLDIFQFFMPPENFSIHTQEIALRGGYGIKLPKNSRSLGTGTCQF